ncbi:hypothetical protein E2C01_084850 [Portunus trituberculatus]|uniref:Uncharacterized protein n=1 Tax=Portunus trituberculatus TaxID=210409 RepID=A0A5B7J8U9_PORTR|nr:hypothetical protein [Portunus trituberculatus]
MAQPSAPPLQDKSALPSHQEAPLAPCYPEPPPPYTPNDPGVSVGPAPTAQPTGPYLHQPPIPVMAAPPVQPPVQMVVAPAAQPSQVIVVGAGLAPGTCTVCRVRSAIQLYLPGYYHNFLSSFFISFFLSSLFVKLYFILSSLFSFFFFFCHSILPSLLNFLIHCVPFVCTVLSCSCGVSASFSRPSNC